jgi:hypothetical protein
MFSSHSFALNSLRSTLQKLWKECNINQSQQESREIKQKTGMSLWLGVIQVKCQEDFFERASCTVDAIICKLT